MSIIFRKIQDFLKGAYEQLLNEKIIITAHYGKAVTFPFLFVNMSQTPSSYKISILYTEGDDEKELTVVKGNKEWRYLTNKQ